MRKIVNSTKGIRKSFFLGLSSSRDRKTSHSTTERETEHITFSINLLPQEMSSAPTASNTTENSQQRPPRQRNGPPPPRRQGRNPPPQTRARYQQTNQGLQEKKKPVFVKVDQLKPGTSGHTLTVKVVDQNSVPQKAGAASSHLRPVRIAECLVGDETASILFTARNDQVDLMKPGTTVNLRNAKIDMFKGSMRLAVDKWGRIEVTEPADITVKEDNNLSLVEYELVNVE